MTTKNDLSNERIPLVEVVCPKCGTIFFVPKCINADIIICPCCYPTKPCI